VTRGVPAASRPSCERPVLRKSSAARRRFPCVVLPLRARLPECGDGLRRVRSRPSSALGARTGERRPPCGVPSAVAERTDVSRSPACSQVLRMVCSIGRGASTQGWRLGSQQDGMAPARLHGGLVRFQRTMAHGSIASAQHRACLNPDAWGSAVVSAMGASACPYSACRARSCLVGLPKGRFVPCGGGRDTRRSGSVLSPRGRSACLAIPGLAGSCHGRWAPPGVGVPWCAVTRLTARACPLNEWVSTDGQAFTVCPLSACVACTMRACSRRTVSVPGGHGTAGQATEVGETAPAECAAVLGTAPLGGAPRALVHPPRREGCPLARRGMVHPVSGP